jgi:hypothetical protein
MKFVFSQILEQEYPQEFSTKKYFFSMLRFKNFYVFIILVESLSQKMKLLV